MRRGGKITRENIVEALGYIPAGGDNLLTGTRDFSGEWIKKVFWVNTGEKYKGLTVVRSTERFNGTYKRYSVKAGEKYTFSAYVRCDTGKIAQVQLYLLDTSDDGSINPVYKTFIATPEWKRISISFTVNKDYAVSPRCERQSEETVYIYTCGYKLEEGEVSNPVWTPAIEDYTDNLPFIHLGSGTINDPDEWIQSIPANVYCTFLQTGNDHYGEFYCGNNQLILAWGNAGKHYALFIAFGFGGIIFGRRHNEDKFKFERLNTI